MKQKRLIIVILFVGLFFIALILGGLFFFNIFQKNYPKTSFDEKYLLTEIAHRNTTEDWGTTEYIVKSNEASKDNDILVNTSTSWTLLNLFRNYAEWGIKNNDFFVFTSDFGAIVFQFDELTETWDEGHRLISTKGKNNSYLFEIRIEYKDHAGR